MKVSELGKIFLEMLLKTLYFNPKHCIFIEKIVFSPKTFSFDNVFAPDSAQSLIYEQSAFFLVESVLDGYNGTIFAYGQTGCGKTHTMMGGNESE